MALKMHIF